MKKLSLILASLVLFAGMSFANPIVSHSVQQAKTDKKTDSKDGKAKKVKVAKRKPVRKP